MQHSIRGRTTDILLQQSTYVCLRAESDGRAIQESPVDIVGLVPTQGHWIAHHEAYRSEAHEEDHNNKDDRPMATGNLPCGRLWCQPRVGDIRGGRQERMGQVLTF